MLQITSNIDPMEYNLSFERFLTEDRSSPPDWIHNYIIMKTQSSLVGTLGVKCHELLGKLNNQSTIIL